MKKQGVYPDLKISVYDQKESGYVREDTIGTKNEIKKMVADAFYIPNEGRGIRFVKIRYGNEGEEREIIDREVAIKMIENKDEGYEEIVAEPYEIRYINGCPSIDREWQESHGWKPRPDPKSDEIMIENGYAEIQYSVNPSKYKYLKESVWNKDLPFRLEHVKPLYYEVKENQKDVLDITRELAITEAMKEWEKLVVKTKEGISLNGEKINGLAVLLNVTGLNETEKLTAILTKLKSDPLGFIEKVNAFKEQIVTEITHAMQLELIKFEGNSAVFTFNHKKIDLGNLGGKQNKIEKLAELLKTEDNKALLATLKSRIQVEKEKKLN